MFPFLVLVQIARIRALTYSLLHTRTYTHAPRISHLKHKHKYDPIDTSTTAAYIRTEAPYTKTRQSIYSYNSFNSKLITQASTAAANTNTNTVYCISYVSDLRLHIAYCILPPPPRPTFNDSKSHTHIQYIYDTRYLYRHYLQKNLQNKIKIVSYTNFHRYRDPRTTNFL